MPAFLPFQRTRFERRHLDLDGTRVYYRMGGVGPPLVLIHGLSGSGRWWQRNVGALAKHFQVFVVDLVGFGRSRGPFVLAEAASVLAAWMEHLGLGRAHVVGHSMGGYIAAEMAAGHRAQVERLVLVDAAAFPLGWHPLRHAFNLLRAVRYMHPTFLPVLLLDALRAGPRLLWKASREVVTVDFEARCKHVDVPTLVVWGEHDAVIPRRVGERLTQCLSDATFVVVDGAGHNPMWDRPKPFNRVLLGFLGVPA